MPDRFNQLAQDYFEYLYRETPTLATELGIHTYDDRLDDVSASALRAFAARLKEFRAAFEVLEPRDWQNGLATDYELVRADIDETLLSLEGIRDWKRNPAYYVEEPLFAVYLLLSREFAPRAERLGNAAARLAQLPDVLAAGRANLENSPHILIEIALDETEGALDFCDDLVAHLAAPTDSLTNRLRAATDQARAALRDYDRFLQHVLLPRAVEKMAIGRANFEQKLRVEHFIFQSADEVAAIGAHVFGETAREMAELARQIDPRRTWMEIVREARRETLEPETLLGAFRAELARLREFIVAADLLTMPDEACEVVETPPFERATNVFAAYVAPGPFEANQAGVFWVTPVDPAAARVEQREQLEEHCLYNYPITAAHEAYPGHHVQLVRANQVASRWRKHFSADIFAEGWALYGEQLMTEVGYFRDPRVRLFQLKDRLWRAARVMMDVGLHCDGLSREDVVRFLVEKVEMTPSAAQAEVKRYAAAPTQPLSYLMGELEILKLRERFGHLSLREFHDALLSSGTIPFMLVEREMEGRETGKQVNKETRKQVNK
jgi:uncharacterized protein (DUF885 family)